MNFMIKIKAEGILNCIALNRDIAEFQRIKEELENPLEYVKNLQDEKQISTVTQLILNSTGISHNNTVIKNCTHLLEIALYLVKNRGCFIIGEHNTGKSTLFTHFLKKLVFKTSGALTTALLIGNANITDENKIKDSDILLEKPFIAVEEFVDEASINDSSVIGTIKNSLESGTLKKCKRTDIKTETTMAFIGNSYHKITKKEELSKIRKDIPQSYQDRGLHDRIPFLLPHFCSLFGKVKYVESDSEVIPVQHLQQILQELRNVPNDKIYITSDMGISSGRELNIYNSFIAAICKLYYYNKEAPRWFIYGWLEFLKFYRSILIEEKVYNPFNKSSARFISEMLGYSPEEIDYVTFDNDRILIKLNNRNEIHKIALTGFAIESNKREWEFYSKTKSEIISPILNHNDDYLILTQEIHGEFPFESRIYFDNIKKHNAEKTDKRDERFNILLLQEIERYALLGKKFNEKELKFRGVPEFYENLISMTIKKEFNYEEEKDINLSDVSFDSDRFKIINFWRYIKKDI